jgi:hypothetical protein
MRPYEPSLNLLPAQMRSDNEPQHIVAYPRDPAMDCEDRPPCWHTNCLLMRTEHFYSFRPL